MLKKNLLILFCALSGVNFAVGMDVTLPSQVQESEDHSTIITQEGYTFSVPDSLLRLSETLKNLMQDVDTVSNAIPLPNITGKAWQFIVTQLERVYALNLEREQNIKTALEALAGSDLIDVIIAVNYLDIPDLLRLAMDVAKVKDIQLLDFEQLNTLPKVIRNLIIVRQLLNMIGPMPVKQTVKLVSEYDIYSVCITHDNKIIEACKDYNLRVWDMQGNLLAICEGHTAEVNSVCVTHDNNIVSGSADGTVRVWDIATGKQLEIYTGHTKDVWSVCVTPDNRIVSGSEDRTVRIWDRKGKEPIILNIPACARSVCVTHTSHEASKGTAHDYKIVVGSWDSIVRVLDMQGNLLAQCNGHEDWVNSVCVTHDNKIVSASKDATVRVWDMQGNILALCKGHQDSVVCVCVTQDNKIVSSSRDGKVRVWDIQGNPLAICIGHKEVIWAVCVTRDNKIVSGSEDRIMRIWDMQVLTDLQNINPEQAKAIWSFLQKELLPMLKTGYVKVDSANCWARIKAILDARDTNEKVGGESALKRQKSGE